MATTKKATSPQEILAKVYEGGLSTREIAARAASAAEPKQNAEMALEGWADAARDYEASLWARSTRKAKQGPSGRYTGLFDQFVATNDGTHYRVADITVEVAALLASDYRARKLRNAKGERFWAKAADLLRENDLATVADLGAERLEALREQCGYRV